METIIFFLFVKIVIATWVDLLILVLINHPLIKLYREKYKLLGKTGKIPSFLCDKLVYSSDDNDKMQFYKDGNDNLKLKYLPKTKYMTKKDGNIEFEIVCDEQDKDMIIDNNNALDLK